MNRPRPKDYVYCRIFYMRKDGTMYVQANKSAMSRIYAHTRGTYVEIPTPSGKVLTGIHTETKKCGIILSNWEMKEC